jgi:hypothetical protein
MITLNCPSCGAGVNFQSKSSVFAVCSFCKASLVREDVDLTNVGKMSDLRDDLTPLQVGTTGKYGGKNFELAGRLKIGYSDGFWNEWFAVFADDKIGWLAEAQGFLGMCFPYNETEMPTRDKIGPGMQIELSDQGIFEVEDVREVHCLFSEGELPLQAAQGRKSTSVDLSGDDRKMATIEYAEKETRLFIGTYDDFDNFHFKNLRSIDGW